jgi:hypothetical protein
VIEPMAPSFRSPRSAALWLLAGALVACGEGDAGQSVPQAPEPTAEPAWDPQVRRPTWRFVYEKTGERCVVLRIDDNERITRGEEAACPVDLQVGERIRLAGRSCMREGPDVTRILPVVCPDPLTNAERDFLIEKGLQAKE